MQVREFSIRGIGPFSKSTTFKVTKGLTCIYGSNLSKGGNGNAVGKSLLTSVVRDVIYSKDKEKGSRRLVFESHGKEVVITTGKTTKVLIDGEVETKRTQTATRELIESLWPISELDYMTYGMLDLQPHPLLRGTAAERRSFFNQFFRFNEIDLERKKVNEHLAEVKKAKAALHEVEAALALVPLIEVDEADLNRARLKLERVAEKAEQHQATRQLFALKKLGKGIDLKNFQAKYKVLKKQAADLENFKERQDAYEDYREALARYKEASSKRLTDLSLDELSDLSDQYNQFKSKAEDELLDMKKEKKVPVVKGSRDKILGELAQVKEQLLHVKKHKQGVCYACGSEVKVSVKDLQAKREQLQDLIEAHDLHEEVIQFNKEVVVGNERAERLNAEIKKAKAKVKEAKDAYHDYKLVRNLTRPDRVERPERVECDTELLDRYHIVAPQLERVIKAQTIDEAPAAIDLGKYAAEVATLEAQLGHSIENNKRRSALLKRQRKLLDVTEKEKMLNVLKAAYSDKGIKAMASDIITLHLMKTVNLYASMIFDDYRFGFDLKSMQFMVTRGSGEVTSVRKLSGAETKLFTFVVALSLLQFVPKDKRLNLLILDEPGASFSPETRVMFNRLLKEMLKVVPSIIIVTPGKEEYPDARNYTVERTPKGSILRDGPP